MNSTRQPYADYLDSDSKQTFAQYMGLDAKSRERDRHDRNAAIRMSRRPVRTCLWALHMWCRICNRRIVRGDRYHDGGAGRMAHVRCVR